MSAVMGGKQAYNVSGVRQGILVDWYPDGDETGQPHPAIISKVGFDSVCLNIFDPTSYNLRIRDGVRHIKDPRAKDIEMRDSGAWDFTEDYKELQDLKSRFKDLEAKVQLIITADRNPVKK